MLRHVASCLLCLVLFTAGFAASAAEAPPRPEPVVDVERDGSHLAVDIKMTVAVPVATAWDVLTDFPNMARFVPNLSASDSVSEAPNRLRVTQKGTARWGRWPSTSSRYGGSRCIRCHESRRRRCPARSRK